MVGVKRTDFLAMGVESGDLDSPILKKAKHKFN